MSKISIILPTYNVEPYIEKALQSCINQTFKDIEIIVVDDCGNDKSIDIAKEYAKKDERIKIVHNEKNLGLLRARYEGVKASHSFYIMFLDPDDYLELNACEECVKILDSNNDVDLICFNYNNIKPTYIEKFDFFTDAKFNQEEFVFFLISRLTEYNWNIWSKIYKKEIYLKIFEENEKLKFLRINMAEDALFFVICLNYINNIQTISQKIYNYNTCNLNSSTKTIDIQKNISYAKDLDNCMNFMSIFINQIDNKFLFYYCLSIFYWLKMHYFDLVYKYLEKRFLHKFKLRIERKMVKIKKRKVYRILKEKNVSSSL
ncbi:glycosyltransferase family 2 protein [Campylobacter sp. B0100352/1]|uniref:glycosyltransferase family 2 protein n=1 Tax=Campylobacter sp. B0100352/1 TaxID=2735783 RepID=UPI001D90B3FD|nr:glycosyltransferase family 2 protein [Campylobacter sp. B0100352/1]